MRRLLRSLPLVLILLAVVSLRAYPFSYAPWVLLSAVALFILAIVLAAMVGRSD